MPVQFKLERLCLHKTIMIYVLERFPLNPLSQCSIFSEFDLNRKRDFILSGHAFSTPETQTLSDLELHEQKGKMQFHHIRHSKLCSKTSSDGISKLNELGPDMFGINLKIDARTAHSNFHHRNKVKMTRQIRHGFISITQVQPPWLYHTAFLLCQLSQLVMKRPRD